MVNNFQKTGSIAALIAVTSRSHHVVRMAGDRHVAQ